MSENPDGKWQMQIKNFNQGIRKIYQNKEFSDVVFKVQGQDFQAHRLILASRSSKFVNMLLKNYSGDEIEIKDDSVTKTGFEIVLRYAYTDEIGTEDKKSIIEGYLASQYFQIKKLMAICKEKIETWEIAVNEVCVLLDEGLSIPLLKINYLAYIRNHANEVVDSSSFLNVSFKCMEAILENGALNDVPNLKRFQKIMEWASNRHNKPVKYELIRKEFENSSLPLLSKLGIKNFNLKELTEVSEKYHGFLTNLEIMAFVVYQKDKNIQLPSWCTPAL